MGRPSASPENREKAILFARGVTTTTDANSDIIARSGVLSLFSAFARCAPSLVRVDSTSKRDSISELEFNKELQSVGFQRLRDRRSVAKSKKDHPDGVGLYLFCKRRWLDPANKADKQALVKCWTGLVKLEKAFKDECPLDDFLQIVAEVRQEWIPKTARKRAARVDSHAHCSSPTTENEESASRSSSSSSAASRVSTRLGSPPNTRALKGAERRRAKQASAMSAERQADSSPQPDPESVPAVQQSTGSVVADTEAVELEPEDMEVEGMGCSDARAVASELSVAVDEGCMEEEDSDLSSPASCDDYWGRCSPEQGLQGWPSLEQEDPCHEAPTCRSAFMAGAAKRSGQGESVQVLASSVAPSIVVKQEHGFELRGKAEEYLQYSQCAPQQDLPYSQYAEQHNSHGYSQLHQTKCGWTQLAPKVERFHEEQAIKQVAPPFSVQPDGWEPEDDALVFDVMNAMKQF